MSTPQQSVPEMVPESAATPPQLAGLTLPQPPVGPTSAPAGKEPTVSTANAQSQQFLPFISLVHAYLWSAITLADQKAGFVFAVDSAFVGYLLSAGAARQLRTPGTWHLLQWSALVSLVFLGVSIGGVVNVVMPRLGGKSSGLIYFKAVSARKNSERYVVDVLSSTDSGLNAALAEHSYEVARISTQKYQHLRFAMWVGVVGFLAGLVFIGLT
jgi:hypothetical protein